MNIKIGPVNISVTLGNSEVEKLIQELGDKLMSKLDPIKVAVEDLKTAVAAEIARVEEDVQALKDAIAAGTVTDEDVQAVVDSLKGVKDAVSAVDPVKPAPPVETPPIV